MWFVYLPEEHLASTESKLLSKGEGSPWQVRSDCESLVALLKDQSTAPFETPPLTFSIADICEVLTLHYFLHYVISIDPGVIHSGWVTLHRILFPPEERK